MRDLLQSQYLPVEMLNFTADEISEIVDKRDNIQSMSVTAHNDHGKSTLTDFLNCKAGIISAKQAGGGRAEPLRDHQEHMQLFHF